MDRSVAWGLVEAYSIAMAVVGIAHLAAAAHYATPLSTAILKAGLLPTIYKPHVRQTERQNGAPESHCCHTVLEVQAADRTLMTLGPQWPNDLGPRT